MVSNYMVEEATVRSGVTLVANDNWLEYTVRYVVDFKKRRLTKDALFTRILDEIDLTNGKVGMASMTVHLVEMPTVDVRMSKETSS